jgi:hypothetical protein
LLLHLAIEGIDELVQLLDSEILRQQEIESLRQKLADAERMIERLYLELNGMIACDGKQNESLTGAWPGAVLLHLMFFFS